MSSVDPRGFLTSDTRVQEAISATAPSEPQAGLRPFDVLGAYQVLRKLGGGGMAEVYLARAELGQGVEKLVALKTALPAFGPDTRLGTMFLHEARVSTSLQHPNVIQVFDYGEAAGRPYLAMEFLQGRDLEAVLERQRMLRRYLPISTCVALVIELCRALEYVHDKRDLDGRPLSLVHRDVSPANVFLTARNEVKLMDFGVVAEVGGFGSSIVAGKQAYLPPEQVGGGNPEAGWDLYALGVVLRQALTLEPLISDPRRPPSGLNPQVPPDLDQVVLAAMHPVASRRYRTAQQLCEDLTRVQAQLAPGPPTGALVQELFRGDLDREEREVADLVAEGRRRAPRRHDLALLRPVRVLRRRVAGSRRYMQLVRRRWPLPLAASLLLCLLVGGGWAGVTTYRAREAMRHRLALADERIAQGRLSGSGGDSAVDHLLAAARQDPLDPRVAVRLGALAEKLESLGELARKRGDLAEAVVHFEAALQADPARGGARTQLEQVERAVREQARTRVRRSR